MKKFVIVRWAFVVGLPCVGAALAVGCSASSDQDAAEGTPDAGRADGGSLPDATTPAVDAGKDADRGVDAAPDATSASDAGPDARDAAAPAVDAARDSAPPADAARDSAPPADAAPDAPAPADASSDASSDAAPLLDAAPNVDAALDAGPPSDPIGVWHFDEGTGTTSADGTAGGHTATFAGGVGWTTGKAGNAIVLDGTPGTFANLGAAVVDTTKSFSFSFWTKPGALTPWSTILSQDANRLSVFSVKLRGDTFKFDFDYPSPDVDSPSAFVVAEAITPAVVGTWYHLAGVYTVGASDAGPTGHLDLYVNGAWTAAQAGGLMVATTGNTIVGAGKYTGNRSDSWNGVIDELQLFARPLSAAEVSAIYASTP